MAEAKYIIGNTTDDLWKQVSADLSGKNMYEYYALLVQDERKVELVIDIDLGGGFESGSASTSFTAPVTSGHVFRFALHHQGLIDSAGKFFGMEDVVLGYKEFDDALIIKTNDRDRTRRIFYDEKVRKVFQSLRSFTLHLVHHHVADHKEKQCFLELSIEEGVTDPAMLRNLYEAFCIVLEGIEAN